MEVFVPLVTIIINDQVKQRALVELTNRSLEPLSVQLPVHTYTHAACDSVAVREW